MVLVQNVFLPTGGLYGAGTKRTQGYQKPFSEKYQYWLLKKEEMYKHSDGGDPPPVP